MIAGTVRARTCPSPQPSPHREERWGEGAHPSRRAVRCHGGAGFQAVAGRAPGFGPCTASGHPRGRGRFASPWWFVDHGSSSGIGAGHDACARWSRRSGAAGPCWRRARTRGKARHAASRRSRPAARGLGARTTTRYADRGGGATGRPVGTASAGGAAGAAGRSVHRAGDAVVRVALRRAAVGGAGTRAQAEGQLPRMRELPRNGGRAGWKLYDGLAGE